MKPYLAFFAFLPLFAHANSPALYPAGTPSLPMPTLTISDVVVMPMVIIAQTYDGRGQIDVTLIDDFIDDISPNARHYPPNFPNRTALHYARETIKRFVGSLEPYAQSQEASFDVLMRATKLNAMGRNLDLGSEYGVRASSYVVRALQLQPDHPEANFLYGMMLSEGGGFKEGKKYLEKAVSLGYLEAEQSLAQADLLSDDRPSALARLEQLARLHPTNVQLQQQVAIVQNGGYYIWDIKDNDINVKPVP